MAIIPAGEKVFMVSNGTNTTYSGSAALKAMQQWYTMQDVIDSVGGGLEGTQYVYVAADGTDTSNAIELQAAYNTAKTMSPSITKRITVIAAPGNYNFGVVPFVMDTQYIDLVSLDGNRSIVFNSSNTLGRINITANDVFVKGVDVGVKSFIVATNLNLSRIENCKGGSKSFEDGLGGNMSGTFTNCTGGTQSFAFGGTASGTFIDCIGGGQSFGFAGTASGVFNNCVAGDTSFGSFGTLSGTLISCTSPLYCSGGPISGKLYFCRQNTTGNALPIILPNSAGRLVAFITKDNNFIAQQ